MNVMMSHSWLTQSCGIDWVTNTPSDLHQRSLVSTLILQFCSGTIVETAPELHPQQRPLSAWHLSTKTAVLTALTDFIVQTLQTWLIAWPCWTHCWMRVMVSCTKQWRTQEQTKETTWRQACQSDPQRCDLCFIFCSFAVTWAVCLILDLQESHENNQLPSHIAQPWQRACHLELCHVFKKGGAVKAWDGATRTRILAWQGEWILFSNF